MQSQNLEKSVFIEAARELAKNAEMLAFGTVGVVMTIHNSVIVKIDYSTTELKRKEVKNESNV